MKVLEVRESKNSNNSVQAGSLEQRGGGIEKARHKQKQEK